VRGRELPVLNPKGTGYRDLEPSGTPRIYRSGRLLDPALTVAEAGLTALDRVDLVMTGGS
jgi:hypothetical protein